MLLLGAMLVAMGGGLCSCGEGKEDSGAKKENGRGRGGNAGGTPDPNRPGKVGPVELEVNMPSGVHEVSRGKSITLALRVRQANAPADANIELYCVGVRQVKRVIGQGNGDFNIRLRVRANRDISDDMLKILSSPPLPDIFLNVSSSAIPGPMQGGKHITIRIQP